ncbi:tRNA1(Val) (adenine(37)-N6)-methyltransferase [Clostridium tagluense]|uniref:tRNA1(Val) (adenine(37)-N6)-methyltransferase n=1 Tax=Clostridium tagluense TaxID=360422 RepID=UPI001C0E2E61|nr:tRNA1(Val) (adenine(37)-N6)-methyltransferase [Clostridium tagluense]MBU3129661.1 tRNA1(Val) (adenine(37)-N6)-methyltransferase [Clostridium tagluense]MBW9158393.1 tRNA1(Val) (adenine(37)-N6)-methyltransferase [Clostridium tagluense]WLC65842.1 tRNA1(Val) (adenine(37)-N6)-methyltransferase [Clostridium tagluense]
MEFLRNDETLDDLNLKGIQVIQKKDDFRFGVDAVLLANFAKVRKNAKVVDLCSGTGIIPFILAGKTYASDLIGVELQEEFVEMANRSIKFNKLEDKMKFICGDLKNIKFIKSIPKVDIVTVNPPYKLQNSGLINLNDKNAIARHEICCTLEDVIIAIRILLKDSGRVYMVHRPDRLVDILCTMRKHRIEPKRIRMVHPSVNKAPNIVLIEGQRDGGTFLKWETPLYVHSEDGGYTQEIIDMYNSDTI